jgi:hypothetical protein
MHEPNTAVSLTATLTKDDMNKFLSDLDHGLSQA